jgi:hypothetical protein
VIVGLPPRSRTSRTVGLDGCNRQAVYNYEYDNWTFDDLPYVFSASRCNVDTTLTYATITSTYITVGGSYQDQSNSAKRPLCYVGADNATSLLTRSVYAFDLYGQGSDAAYPVDEHATLGFYLERDGIDLDELADDLPGYKVLSSLYPQGRIDPDGAAITFTMGGSDYFTVNPVYSPPQVYDAAALYKLDYNVAGRWFNMQISYPDYRPMTLTGFDLDLMVDGER